MVLKLTGGKWKGKQIQAACGRPTSSLVRQALFEILPCVAGDSVLDLFAGSGVLGLEALSRGAEQVIAVDRCPNSRKIMATNKKKLAFEMNFFIFPVAVETAMKRLVGRKQFNWIFADPPYDYVERWFKSKDLFQGMTRLLLPGGCFVLEHALRSSIPFSEWKGTYKRRLYGKTVLSFFSIQKNRSEGGEPI
ncbi:RsmD family RNA methyltransferase [Candidatus Similichlamydia laticola]|uniref:16S rRNA (Guanine(966)-N(2))-methyltransferase n=1 Tax=Candidatus Similichlamydia laticola TaxID=2170265 RepID=A0A369KCF2_9BACT|nr:RsmD family RNA methyltransferase [Candidatus Similichlamydia laticola]RDB31130.1 16S rRNA (guanine(966)-N(2))-methyltransferase [Candidatus Similichlamydia laticola]